MKSRITAVLFIVCTWYAAALTADDSTKTTEEVSRQISFYQEEASKLGTSDIYKELKKQLTILSGLSFGEFTSEEDTIKAVGYFRELEARRKANEPAAAFYYGIYNWRICNGLESGDKAKFADVAKNCWLESLESLKVASNAQIAEASFNIGRMYEEGWGVSPSKFVAADWFVKAAQQFKHSDSRDGTLMSTEAALNIVPDHPAALRLKKALLK
jgi:TPR repeat protein